MTLKEYHKIVDAIPRDEMETLHGQAAEIRSRLVRAAWLQVQMTPDELRTVAVGEAAAIGL